MQTIYYKFFILMSLFWSTAGSTAPRAEQNITHLYPSIAAQLAKSFFLEQVVLVEGLSTQSLDLARFQENEATVAVVVAESSQDLFIYLEPCDICALLVRAAKSTTEIETLLQSHQISCSDLQQELAHKIGPTAIHSTICDSFL